MSNNKSATGLPKSIMLRPGQEDQSLTDYVEDENYVDELDAINDETFGADEDDAWDPDAIYEEGGSDSANGLSGATRLSDLMAAASISANQPFDDPAIVTCQRAPQPARRPSPSPPPPRPAPQAQTFPKAPPPPPVSATTLEELESTFSPISTGGLLGNSVWALTKDEQAMLTSWPEPQRIQPPQHQQQQVIPPQLATNYLQRPPIPQPPMPTATPNLLTCESLEKDLISFSEPPPQQQPPPPVAQPPPGLPPLPMTAVPIRLEDLEKEIMQPPAAETRAKSPKAASSSSTTGDPTSANPWVKRALDFEEQQRHKDQQRQQQQLQRGSEENRALPPHHHKLHPTQPPQPPKMLPQLMRPAIPPHPFPPTGLPGMMTRGGPYPYPSMLMRPPPMMPPVHPLLTPMNLYHHRFGPPPMAHQQLPQHRFQQQQQPLFQGMQDEYAGLMTPKEKDWLHKIQFFQLEGSFTDPYKEDYYSVALNAKKLEKQASAKGGPVGPVTATNNSVPHPQLIVPERGARRDSNVESNNNGNAARSTKLKYEPLQFAGSLGKIQVSSLNRPRKLLELNALNATTNAAGSTAAAPLPSAHELAELRKLLLEIERLYRVALDVDDESRRMAALPEGARGEHAERHRELCQQLFNGLLAENGQLSVQIASIRKGRMLIFRALSVLSQPLQKAFLIKQVLDLKLYALQKPEEVSLYGTDYLKVIKAEIEALPEAQRLELPAPPLVVR